VVDSYIVLPKHQICTAYRIPQASANYFQLCDNAASSAPSRQLFMTEWVKGVVVSNTHWTDNLFSLRIDAGMEPHIAGQYTSLALDIDGERVAQPYSILSGPGEKPLEFFLYTQLEGDLSRALSRLKPDDTLWVQKNPEGTLTLQQVPDVSTLFLMATGTGVAPFISMLKSPEPWARFRQIILVYAVRVYDDLRYEQFFLDMLADHPDQFHFQPFVSREQIKGAFTSTLHGHIPASLRSGELERQVGITLSPESTHIMLCGNPGMVKDTVTELQARGFRERRPGEPGQITHESYW
jgi:ferredoxin/flavodoxin---NADP+ reductase